MQIHKFREKNLAEDYMDIHYREENAQIRGLFSYLDSMTAVVGKNDHGEVLQLNRSYKNDFYKFIFALRGGRENHAADH